MPLTLTRTENNLCQSCSAEEASSFRALLIFPSILLLLLPKLCDVAAHSCPAVCYFYDVATSSLALTLTLLTVRLVARLRFSFNSLRSKSGGGLFPSWLPLRLLFARTNFEENVLHLAFLGVLWKIVARNFVLFNFKRRLGSDSSFCSLNAKARRKLSASSFHILAGAPPPHPATICSCCPWIIFRISHLVKIVWQQITQTGQKDVGGAPGPRRYPGAG